MRVLITGGAGFIGSHLADRLVARGDRVTIVDNFETGRRENVDLPNVYVEEMDVAFVGRAVRKFHPDVIVHAAASYRDPSAWDHDAATNVQGTIAVVEAARNAGTVERVVYFQTSLCYGLAPPRYPLPETWAIDPHGSYAITKTAAEQFVLQNAPNPVSFRLANIYGPRNLSGPVPAFWKRIDAGEPCTIVRDARRDFVYVDDAVDLFERAVDGDGPSGVYHCSTGRDFPIDAIYELVKLQTLCADRLAAATFVPRGDDDAPSILLDPQKAANVYGWKAKTRLDVGVEKACAWYAENGVPAVHTHLTGKVAKG